MTPLPVPLPSHVPASVRDAAACDAGRRYPGCSGADVFRLATPVGDAFLKVQLTPPAGNAVTLRRERENIDWLAHHAQASDVAVARVLAYAETQTPAGTWAYLLTSAVPGRPLHESVADTPIRVGRMMGNALRWMHALPPAGLVAHTPDILLARAEHNVAHNTISGSTLRRGDPKAARRLLRRLMRQAPPADTSHAVVSHFDFCLPNVLADLGDRPGVIDVGQLCVCDRHLDVASAVRSLMFNGLRDDVVRVFRNWYGPDRLDDSRLDFYAGLCELL